MTGAPHQAPTSADTVPPVDDVLRQRLVDAQQQAADYFVANLRSEAGRGPLGYLHERGIGGVLAGSRWTVGYAPPGWTGLTRHLRAVEFSDDEQVLAGLAQRTRRGTIVDRFRDRVTFGVRDSGGVLVGFVARCAPGERGEVAKYLNTPRTPIYDKGAVLFGLAEQSDELASGATPVIVEGPLDVLAVAAAFRDEPTYAALAPCGTALTEAHVAAIASVITSRTVEVAFDSDAAGDRAATTAYQLLTPRVPRLRAARLPRGTDPADLLNDGGHARLRAALVDSVPLADRVVDRVLGRYRDLDDNAEAQAAALHQVAPRIAAMRPAEVAREVARVAAALRFDPAVVTGEVAEAAAPNEQSRISPTASPGRTASTSAARTHTRGPAIRLH